MVLTFDVKKKTEVLSPGDPVPAINTPTLATLNGDYSLISTDPKPVERFYQSSVAQAVAAKKPFLIVFATPKFCTSAACGPTLDKVKTVADSHPELTIIHLEPYKLQLVDGAVQPVLDAQGSLTPTDATTAFGLQTEPSVFVVGGDGRVAAYFELVFTPDEIDQAIKAVNG
jgi:hypothetical protein